MSDEAHLKQTGTSIHHQAAIGKVGLEKIERLSAEWSALLTIGKPLALCNEGGTIKEHPCPAIAEPKEGDDVLQGMYCI